MHSSAPTRVLIVERNPVLTTMLELQEKYGGSVILLMEVPPEQTNLYGCAAIEATDTTDVVRITDLIEKPDPADAPSNLAIIGRYVCDPAIFDVLRETPPGRGGEIQLTDALRTLAVWVAAAVGRSPDSCSAVGATTPATAPTTCVRSCGSPVTGQIWDQSSGPG